MNFASVRIITNDVDRLAGFYEKVLGVSAERPAPFVEQWVQEPTTMPWGNRSILFRDPDGNLVNLFEPETEEAIKRFSGRQAFSQRPKLD